MTPKQKPSEIIIYDFEGYDYYLAQKLDKILPKTTKLPAAYLIEKPAFMIMMLTSPLLLPRIPSGSKLEAYAIPLNSIESMSSGLYVLFCADKKTGKIAGVEIGRLKTKPVKDTLTLWPDNPKFKSKTVRLQTITFVFRITHFIPPSDVDEA